MSDDWYGSRAKIGLVYIASSWVAEPEFYKAAPPGVTIHTTRVFLKDVTVKSLREVGRRAVEAAGLLAQAHMSVIILACTSGTFIRGIDYDREIAVRMTKAAAGIPCSTTSAAVLQAIQALGVRKIAVGTPYPDEISRLAGQFIESQGYVVTKLYGLGLTDDVAINNVTLNEVYQLARSVDSPDSEAVFLACTGLRSFGVIEALEKDLGKPVFSSNLATFWHALRLAGVGDKIAGFGRLLQA
ncbi:MAG: Asp/Glu racemase [Bacillota bacterium]|nr:MAG: Asp/Glu racemase [Bacillota bacterium]